MAKKGYLGTYGPRKCKICKGNIEMVGTYRDGHNAKPVTNGRCCTSCNDLYVIPERKKQILSLMLKK